MLTALRVSNPHYPGAPARMADGRLFTDYRANCSLLGLGSNSGASFDIKQHLQQNGLYMMAADRSSTLVRASSTGGVDTMVPEESKRVCDWSSCRTLPAFPNVGIGQGRLYLPGRPDLANADPDLLAAQFAVPGTFASLTNDQVAMPMKTALPAHFNRYSAPYGLS